MNINDIVTEWKTESSINESKLSDELIRTPYLHAKFLEYYIQFKQLLSNQVHVTNKLCNIKRKYYRGECTKSDLDKYGWAQWQGLKPSSTEMGQLLEYDNDVSSARKKIVEIEDAVKVMEYILKEINQRSYTLKSLIEYQKFLTGA